MVEGGHHLRKAPNSHPLLNGEQWGFSSENIMGDIHYVYYYVISTQYLD